MCGICASVGPASSPEHVAAMVASQVHRGPDAEGTYSDAPGGANLGHNRLSIIDLSSAGRQPMGSADGRYWIVFNGEIYNYLELKRELSDYDYRSKTDTEVILAAFQRWGEGCLDRLVGMFSFAIWDEREQRLFVARDRFGVKSLYYHRSSDGSILLASEIRALHAAGVPALPDNVAWATYLGYGLSDYSERTFWQGIKTLPPGHMLAWNDGRTRIRQWYDLAERVGWNFEHRSAEEVKEEYLALLGESVGLRFRSDVPVGINLSGGLDSSTLLGLVQKVQGPDSDVKAFTFVTGDPNYDELPWVREMLARTRHPSVVATLSPTHVPELAVSVQAHISEPFGGIPTLAYARLFDAARSEGVIVLLDGQGLDEQWAGYDYYRSALDGKPPGVVQGTSESPVRPECLAPEFASLAEQPQLPKPFPDALRNAQYRDARYSKIPRALRFNDRVSMRASTELREPFLDHRLFELALRQPPEHKICDGTSKWLLREIAEALLPARLVEAPKRPLQTPQREWLRGALAQWADDHIEAALDAHGGWFDRGLVRKHWRAFREGQSDNSFYLWQWISLGLVGEAATKEQDAHAPEVTGKPRRGEA